jgi:hypothetical protein
MIFLSLEDGLAWLSKIRSLRSEQKPESHVFQFESQYAVPRDAGRKTALARLLSATKSEYDSECMLWITGYGIWPSSENPELFYSLRRFHGESRRLPDAPCHLFASTESTDLECFLDLALYFSWDARLYVLETGLVIYLSHDEMMSVFCDSEAEFENCRAQLETFGIAENE